ncbi:MAG: hypothetical protein AB7N80_02870 [Bdellovibrionales bacterium]
MALSLDQINRPKSKKFGKKKAAPKVVNTAARPNKRPWQTKPILIQSAASPTRDVALNFEFQPDQLLLTPEDLDATTSAELLQILAQQWLENTWRKTQRRSYWLSRLTHRHSWLARMQIFPRVRIPLPSWLANRDSNDE